MLVSMKSLKPMKDIVTGDTENPLNDPISHRSFDNPEDLKLRRDIVDMEISNDGNLEDIQIHHRDEVIKRISNFKEQTSDVQI